MNSSMTSLFEQFTTWVFLQIEYLVRKGRLLKGLGVLGQEMYLLMGVLQVMKVSRGGRNLQHG